jgi:predicted DNA-binding protein (MmcQ/YjbR family)
MDADRFHEIAMALPGATFDIKWGADRIYSVGGKMFAGAGAVGDSAPRYGFKASDLSFEALIEQGLAVPAPYAARFKWVQLTSADALSDAELTAYVTQAHTLVAAGLSRKLRVSLGIDAVV